MKSLLFLLPVFCVHAGFSQKSGVRELISLKKGSYEYSYPSSGNAASAFSFAVIDPGFPIIPVNGGIYLAGFETWMVKPQVPMYMAVVQNEKDPDSSLLTLKADVTRRKILVQKLHDLRNTGAEHTLFNMPYGIYDIVSVDKSLFYLYGVDSLGSHLWQSDFTGLYPIFNTESAIKDIEIINESNVLMAIDSSIMMVGLQQAPRVILKLDVPVDGVAKDSDGTIFVSTAKGILHFHSLAEDDFDVVTNLIHGKLTIRHNRIFVLWREQNKIIEIKLR